MKGKIILSTFAALLTAVFLSVFAIAATDFTISPSILSFSEGATSANFVITNLLDTASFSFPSTATIGSGSNSLVVSFNNNSFSLLTSGTKTIAASIISGSLSDLDFGTFNTTIVISATNGTDSKNKTLTLKTLRSYCDSGDIGDLDIKNVDFSVKGFGNDDDWYLLDEIEVQVDVKNTGNDDIDNVVLAWALFNKDTGEVIFDDEENDVDIKDGDTETYTFTLAVDPNDFSEDMLSDDIVLLVKAYSDDVGEESQCISEETDINLQIPDHFVALDSINTPDIVPCGGSFQITANAWNIGDRNEEEVTIRVYSNELRIDKEFNVGDLDVLDEKKMTMSLQIPQDASEKQYSLVLSVFDEDSDVFENDDDDLAEFDVFVTVKGSCQSSVIQTSDVTLSTSLESEAKAGEELTIKTTLRNTGNNQTTYTLQASGQDSWSSGLRISQSQVSLNAGESKDILIYLTPNNDASGDNQLVLTASFEGKTKTQNVVINVAESVKFNFNLGNNWYLWLIIGINVILIVVIIIVAVSMSKK